MTYKRKINCYICAACGGTIVTVDADEGTTPFSVLCKATPGCAGRMFSEMYQVDQSMTPGYEWYRPRKLPKEPNMREHVKLGGLLIRKIE